MDIKAQKWMISSDFILTSSYFFMNSDHTCFPICYDEYMAMTFCSSFWNPRQGGASSSKKNRHLEDVEHRVNNDILVSFI